MNSPKNPPVRHTGRPSVFPWGRLAVGQSWTVPRITGRATVYTSLAHFRDKCLHAGWPLDGMPRFDLDWGTPGAVRITRLPDGPLPARGPRRAYRTPRELEHAAIVALYEARLADVALRVRHGLPRGLTDLATIDRAKRFSSEMAQRFADLDLGALADHDDTPDRPASEALAGRCRDACKTCSTPVS